MSITAIEVDRHLFDEMGVGMAQLPLQEPLKMSGIGRVVVLAGPNGGGKTRLLRLIPMLLSRKLTEAGLGQLGQIQAQDERAVRELETHLANLASAEPLDDVAITSVRGQIRDAKSRILDSVSKKRQSDCVTLDTPEAPRVVSLVPKTFRLSDPSDQPPAEVLRLADSLTLSPDEANRAAPAYAWSVLKRSEEVGYKRLRRDSTEGTQSPITEEEASADRLKALLAELLEIPNFLDVEKSRLQLAGFIDYASVLSPGQQILFQFGCLLHAHSANLKNCVVLMDEPENHLHPAVLAQVLAQLRRILGDSQLWIATHSVPLVAQMVAEDGNMLWFVKDGTVSRSGKTRESVLESLLGAENGGRHLHDLTLLPAQFAAVRFLTECLVEPGVVGSNIHDPQTKQITSVLGQLQAASSGEGRPLRVLDFGAGKGRVLATLREDGRVAADWLDYYAYDIGEKNRDYCEREITTTYGDKSKQRWFKDLAELQAQVRQGAFDVVILCNVFHEIRPRDWLPDLGKAGRVTKLLNANGYMLLVEDYGIRVGERAHEFGFLLFDEPELCELFDVTPSDRDAGRFLRRLSTEPKYAERLKAYLVGKDCLERMDRDRQVSAIRTLRDRMTQKVKGYLDNPLPNDGRSGVEYARSAQLMANASIWLTDHGA